MKDAAIRTTNLSTTKQELLRRRLQGESVGQTYKLEPIVKDLEHRFDPFPLTDMVEAQWMGRNRAYDLGNQAAHVYSEFFDGEFDLKRFQDAWNRLINRHEMLRAYVRPDGQYQINREVPPYQIKLFDLRGKSEEEVKEHLFNTRRRMTRHVSRADTWPLFEIVATRVRDDWMRLHLSCDLLISDIKSFQTIGGELAVLYQDPNAKLSPETLEVSYRDYVLALHRFKKGPMFERARKYWIEDRLPVLPPSPALPMRKTPTNVDIPYFVHRAFSVDGNRWRQIKALSKKYDLTPDTTVLAAFVEVMANWNRSLAFTLNVLSFQRIPLHLEINEIVGNFGATVLLAIHNEDGETFVDRARNVRAQLVQDLDHWVFSGVAVLREINRRQGGSLGATMPVVFASTLNFSAGKDPSLLGEMETSFYAQHMRYIQLQTPQVWFDHQVSEDNGNLVLEWDVVEDLFPPGLIDDMWRAYQGIFDRLAAGDDAWLETSRRRLLPPEQLAQRATINATEAPIPAVRLHELFEQQAQRQPNHVAIIAPGLELTYGQLDRMSNQLAHQLRSAGTVPGTLVAVVMDPGWQQTVAVLGILKAGAAYVPIDAAVPAERLAYLLDNGKVAIALTQSHLDDRLSWPSSVRHLVVSSDALSGQPNTALVAGQAQAQTDLAYVIYTSGSTGQPKGVMIDHRGAVNTIVDINQRYKVGPDDRILALASLSFDLSVYDVFGILGAGGAIVVPPASEMREPSTWARLIHEHRITLWNSVPALMEMEVDYLSRHQQRLPDSLRVVLLSGDWIPVRLPDRIRAIARPDVQLISLGGATEASIWSILYPIGEVKPEWTSIPYGKPMLNQRFHVLNDGMDPCPVWVPGQLYIAGDGLAKGYWQDAEKTAASFITHATTGERLYRTGDLGRYLPDGSIEFLGRQDLQVKVLGHRIELGEIEAVLQDNDKVQSVAVVAVGDTSETRRLVAYIVPRGVAPTQEELTTLAQAKLPEYMVPAQMFFLDAMPLSMTGKVDRKALADQRVETHRVYTAPQTQLEKQFTVIWAGILNAERVGIHDSFFEMGGNSLLITHLVARIHEEFGVEMPLRTIYENPTVAGIIPVFEATRAGAPAATASARIDLEAEATLDPTIRG